MSMMTFQTVDTPEFDEVRQQHDAWMEEGRLELMTVESNYALIEKQVEQSILIDPQDFDQSPDSFPH